MHNLQALISISAITLLSPLIMMTYYSKQYS